MKGARHEPLGVRTLGMRARGVLEQVAYKTYETREHVGYESTDAREYTRQDAREAQGHVENEAR